jgi:ADP-ribosylglycohydrolase
LIGQCLGDALGAAVEGRSPADCGYYVNEMLKKGQAGHHFFTLFPSKLSKSLMLS